jgi:hypothetical protein
VVKIYVEGSARDSSLDRSFCRQAFSKFFAAAGLEGKRPRTVPCGGRKAAYNAFVTAIANPRPGELPLLLVDSEAPVQAHRTVWEHLKSRPGDNWDKPAGVGNDQAFLMVQVMETWFVSDRAALKEFFKPKFKDHAIPVWQDLEAVPKVKIYEALESATTECGEKKYSKGNLSFELLAKISPAKVEAASPHAKVLFQRLRDL